MVWTIKAALTSGCFENVYVSTDNEKYKRIAEDAGAEIIDRGDLEESGETPMKCVVNQALNIISNCDALALLQPTSPFRLAKDICEAVDVYEKTASKGLYSVCDKQLYDTGFIYIFDINYFTNEWLMSNDFDFVSKEHIKFITSVFKSLQIDTEEDWEMCEILMKEKLKEDVF